MNKDDTDKNPQKFCTTKIPIPAYNDYLLKDMKHWVKKVYHQVYLKVGWRKAGKIKGIMPIEMAAYPYRDPVWDAEDKVFGNWRLVAPYPLPPSKGVSFPGKSPLQQAIEYLQPHIVPTRWGEFRRKFVRELKLCFNAICDADYPIRDPVRDDPTMVDEVNGRLNQLLSQYTRGGTTPQPPLLRGSCGREKSPLEKGDKGGCVSLRFVLKPETAEDYSSLKNFLKAFYYILEK